MATGQQAGPSDTPSLSRGRGMSSELSAGSAGWSKGSQDRGARARPPAPWAPSGIRAGRTPSYFPPGGCHQGSEHPPRGCEDLFTARAHPPASVEKILTVPQINTVLSELCGRHQIISGL